MRDIVAGYYANRLVLDGVTLVAQPNKVTVLLGLNGSGKSTALRVLYGILAPRGGTVTLGGRDITAVPASRRPELGMAFLPQGRSVFPALTVHENLELGGWPLRRDRVGRAAAVEATYERYPPLKGWRRKVAGSLSGGQQRLLEIARMMVADPQVILVDEPSAGLAPILIEEVYQEIAHLRDEQRTILLVDQNVRAAVDLADHIWILEQGRNYAEGGCAEFEDKLAKLITGWLRP